MRKRERDLSQHAAFVREVIAIIRRDHPNFAVVTTGPWYSAWDPLLDSRDFRKETRGLPRGVFIRCEEYENEEGLHMILVLCQPLVVDGVTVDDSENNSEPLAKFKQTPAVMLNQVNGPAWERAWKQAEAAWRTRGRRVPSFEEFLEED